MRVNVCGGMGMLGGIYETDIILYMYVILDKWGVRGECVL